MRPRRKLFAVLILLLPLACLQPATTAEISRDRAIAIAQQQVTFQPTRVDAVKAASGGRPIWRVTFQGRLPGQPPGLFETRIVEIDRRSGAVISTSRT
jgi:hypothetical protein